MPAGAGRAPLLAARRRHDPARQGFGVPHVYGRDRDGPCSGSATRPPRTACSSWTRCATPGAESSRASPAARSPHRDRDQSDVAPYTEADLQRQSDRRRASRPTSRPRSPPTPTIHGGGSGLHRRRAPEPALMPGEYAAIGRPTGPRTGSGRPGGHRLRVGAIFGKGGGKELDWRWRPHALTRGSKRKRAKAAWTDFRSAEDPEAPVTVLAKPFPISGRRRRSRRAAWRSPTGARCSATKSAARRPARRERGSAGPGRRPAGVPESLQRDAGLREGVGIGKPLAVSAAGRLLQPADPDGGGRPRAEGSTRAAPVHRREPLRHARPGARLRLERHLGRPGHHRHLRGRCEPARPDMRLRVPGPLQADRGARAHQLLAAGRATPPRRAGDHARGAHQARPGRGPRDGQRQPGAATPACARPTSTRPTRPSASALQRPRAIRSVGDFQRAAYDIGYTFHWFYADAQEIAYFNTGNNPLRANSTRASRSAGKRVRVAGLRPRAQLAVHAVRQAPPGGQPAVRGVDWNNKSAKGFAAADSNW